MAVASRTLFVPTLAKWRPESRPSRPEAPSTSRYPVLGEVEQGG